MSETVNNEVVQAGLSERLKNILQIGLPVIEVLATLIEQRDANNTGADDEVAAILKHAVTRLRLYDLS